MAVLKKISAILPTEKLKNVERRLRKIGVGKVTATQSKGFGEYESFLRSGWSMPHVRIDIYCASEGAENIAKTVIVEAHTGSAGGGIVAIQPVIQLYRIRSKGEALEGEI